MRVHFTRVHGAAFGDESEHGARLLEVAELLQLLGRRTLAHAAEPVVVGHEIVLAPGIERWELQV
jgi:hypothetical protein